MKFRRAWSYFDQDANGTIPVSALRSLIDKLSEPEPGAPLGSEPLGWDLKYFGNKEKQDKLLKHLEIP